MHLMQKRLMCCPYVAGPVVLTFIVTLCLVAPIRVYTSTCLVDYTQDEIRDFRLQRFSPHSSAALIEDTLSMNSRSYTNVLRTPMFASVPSHDINKVRISLDLQLRVRDCSIIVVSSKTSDVDPFVSFSNV